MKLRSPLAVILEGFYASGEIQAEATVISAEDMEALWRCWSAIDAAHTLELTLPQFRIFLGALPAPWMDEKMRADTGNSEPSTPPPVRKSDDEKPERRRTSGMGDAGGGDAALLKWCRDRQLRLWDEDDGAHAIRLHYIDVVRVLTREVFMARGSNLPQLDLECETRLLCHLAGGMHGAKAGDVGKGELMATVLAKRLMVKHVRKWRRRRRERVEGGGSPALAKRGTRRVGGARAGGVAQFVAARFVALCALVTIIATPLRWLFARGGPQRGGRGNVRPANERGGGRRDAEANGDEYKAEQVSQ